MSNKQKELFDKMSKTIQVKMIAKHCSCISGCLATTTLDKLTCIVSQLDEMTDYSTFIDKQLKKEVVIDN